MAKTSTPAATVPAGYAVTLEHCDGVVLVACPDIPEVHSVGDDEAEALREAVDAIETALSGYMQDRRPIPQANAVKRGHHLVPLSTLTMAKLALYGAVVAQGLSKAELARRLSLPRPSVDRLLDLRHSSKMEQVDAALASVGQRVGGLVMMAA